MRPLRSTEPPILGGEQGSEGAPGPIRWPRRHPSFEGEGAPRASASPSFRARAKDPGARGFDPVRRAGAAPPGSAAAVWRSGALRQPAGEGLQSVGGPVHFNFAAVQWRNAVVRSRIAPLQCSRALLQNRIAPLHWRIAPLQSSGALLHSAIAPLQRRIAPVHSASAPLQFRRVPLQNSGVPLQSGIAPLQRPNAPLQNPNAVVVSGVAVSVPKVGVADLALRSRGDFDEVAAHRAFRRSRASLQGTALTAPERSSLLRLRISVTQASATESSPSRLSRSRRATADLSSGVSERASSMRRSASAVMDSRLAAFAPFPGGHALLPADSAFRSIRARRRPTPSRSRTGPTDCRSGT